MWTVVEGIIALGVFFIPGIFAVSGWCFGVWQTAVMFRQEQVILLQETELERATELLRLSKETVSLQRETNVLLQDALESCESRR